MDKRWLVLTIKVPSDDARDIVSEGLFALGATSVQETIDGLVTYFEMPDNVDVFVNDIRAQFPQAVAIEHELRDNEDWSQTWKRGLRARRVGKSFIVAPSWTEPEIRTDDHVIVIDPEMAFGTGEHATTRGALRFLEQIVKPGDTILDVGTGSAILAIGAAMLGAGKVYAVDNDPDAILNAVDNVRRNNVAAAIELEEGFVDVAYLSRFGAQHFDVIVANVLSGVLKPLLSHFLTAVKPDGHVILGGILEEEADEMIDASATAGFTIVAEDLEEEWWGVLLRRPS